MQSKKGTEAEEPKHKVSKPDVISVRLPRALYNRIIDEAEERELLPSELVRQLMRDELDRNR